jgi:selenocysteine lyase/cysteine desulfurase
MSTAPSDPRPVPTTLRWGPARSPRLRAVRPAGVEALPRLVQDGLVVPTADGREVEFANFDHAASTPALISVRNAVEAVARTYSSVHRGNGWTSRLTSRWYEEARSEVAAFVDAREGDEVVFTRNTTDAMNLLAHALPRDTSVFVFRTEHHASLLPWRGRRTVRLDVPGSAEDAAILLDEALGANAATHRLLVLTGASNVTGEHWPVAELVAVARRHGARVVLDAAQLAPHGPVSLRDLDVDWVALSGHKLYAPYGAGVLAGRADWLDAATPWLAGGGATVAVSDRGVRWAEGPARHEAGTPNVLGAVALAAACSTLTRHRDAIAAHEAQVADRLVDGLTAIDGVEVHELFGGSHGRAPVATFTIDGVDSSLVSAVLSGEHGIGVRDGKFCAHLLVDDLLAGTGAGTAVRVSAGLATTAENLDRLLAAVEEIATTGPRLDWVRTEEGWAVDADARVDATPQRPW